MITKILLNQKQEINQKVTREDNKPVTVSFQQTLHAHVPNYIRKLTNGWGIS